MVNANTQDAILRKEASSHPSLTIQPYNQHRSLFMKILAVIRRFSFFGVLSAFRSLSVLSKSDEVFLSAFQHFFSGSLDQRKNFKIDTPSK